MPVFGLGQTAVGTGHAFLSVLIGLAYLLIRALEQFGKGKLHLLDDAVGLGQTLLPRFFEESLESVFMQPSRRFGLKSDNGKLVGRLRRREVPEYRRFNQPIFFFTAETQRARRYIFLSVLCASAVISYFHGEETLVDHVAEAVYHAGAVEVQPRRISC